jgi:ATP-dependent RNA helicase MSS116, mitochondrial
LRKQGPGYPTVATTGAMFAHEVGAEGPRRDTRQGPALPRVVATSTRGGGAIEQGADGMEGSASKTDRSVHEAVGVDGTYLTETR